MFGKSTSSKPDEQPERASRVTHTPGAFAPLSPRNDLRNRGNSPGVLGLGVPAQAASPVTPVPSAPQIQSPKEPAMTTSSTPATPSESPSRLVVGPEVKLKGAEILDCDTLIVEGRVEATMDSRVIRITERGAFCGKVGIDVAEIHGHFEGELTARQQLVIHATGRVKGNIRYGSLLIEAGGQISGDVQALSEIKTPLSTTQEKELERPSNIKALISSAA